MKSNLRIALFHNLPSGGARRAIFEFTKGLVARGHRVHEFRLSTANSTFLNMADLTIGETVFPFEVPKYKRLPIPGITPYANAWKTIAMFRGLNNLSRQIASFIDHKNFDVVWVNDCQISLKPFLVRYLRTPYIFYSHHGGTYLGFYEGLEQIGEKGPKTAIERAKGTFFWLPTVLQKQYIHHNEIANARDATYVVTNSSFAAESYYQFFGIPARVVNYGVNHQTFKPSTTDRGEYVLTVGALIYRKGFRFLISALSLLPPEYRLPLKIIANFIDPMEKEKLDYLAKQAQIKIDIQQIFDDDELAQIYQKAKVFLYSPIMEPFGLSPLEALACGTPVIAVKEGGPREIVTDGVTGFLVERDPAVFAEALKLLLQNDKLREEMGANGVEMTHSQWDWTIAATSLEWHLQHAIQLSRKSDHRLVE
jgi:glycosyltransferase involved in cell wall biosynthesis